jgi:hypothetical protein
VFPNQHFKSAAAVALAVGAIAPAAATAAIPVDSGGATLTRPQSQIVHITTPASGFDWGDAGIGAAGGVALAMLGLGGGLVISNHRTRRTRRTTALPS